MVYISNERLSFLRCSVSYVHCTKLQHMYSKCILLCVIQQKCWRMSLRTKMKNIRMPLKLENLQILKEKFGCLGTGGRKRVAETVDEEREACKKRQKLKVPIYFFFLFLPIYL